MRVQTPYVGQPCEFLSSLFQLVAAAPQRRQQLEEQLAYRVRVLTRLQAKFTQQQRLLLQQLRLEAQQRHQRRQQEEIDARQIAAALEVPERDRRPAVICLWLFPSLCFGLLTTSSNHHCTELSFLLLCLDKYRREIGYTSATTRLRPYISETTRTPVFFPRAQPLHASLRMCFLSLCPGYVCYILSLPRAMCMYGQSRGSKWTAGAV